MDTNDSFMHCLIFVCRELISCYELTNGNLQWQDILKLDRAKEAERMKKNPRTPQPYLSQSAPSKLVPSQRAASQPSPYQPGPSKPVPSQRALSQPGPSQPGPSQSGVSTQRTTVPRGTITSRNKTVSTQSTSHSKEVIGPATTLKGNHQIRISGAVVTVNSYTNQTLIRNNAIQGTTVLPQMQRSSQTPVQPNTARLNSTMTSVAPNLTQTLTVQNLNKSETSKLQRAQTSQTATPKTRDLALLKITPTMADNLAKGHTVPIPEDVVAINGMTPHSGPSLRMRSGKVMLTIPNGAEVSRILPSTCSSTSPTESVSTAIPCSTTPALPLTSTVTGPKPISLKSSSTTAPLPAINTESFNTTKPSTNT